jgi:predicted SAM-dependent methyltransferase
MSYTLPFVGNVLELGGGTQPVFRPNLDVRAAENVDIVANFEETLPVEDNSYENIFSKFCIEHISWRNVKKFVKEVYRILKNNGKVVFITANTENQMKWVLEHDEWDDDCSCIIFGDQDYADNTHRNSLNPKHAIKILSEVGFESIIVLPFGELRTDMIIEATKPENAPTQSQERKSLFDKHYFNGGGKVGGYAYEGYWDYPIHWVTYEKIMELEPKSVLEVGCARGYILKKLEAEGIPCKGLEISRHCYLTRVTDAVMEWDICQFPWPFEDKQFDVCYSIAVMEHIPDEFIPKVLAEIDRVSHRGIHGVDYGENDDGFDKTHCSLHTEEWWLEKTPPTQKPVDKELMEKGSLALSIPSGDGSLKLNLGSFTNMYHNGWINIDIVPLQQFAQQHQYKFLHHDFKNKLPFGDAQVDLIYSSHMLEHLTKEEGILLLRDCYRVMKSGSVARFLVPDAERLINMYKNSELGIFDEINDGCEKTPFQSGKLWELLFSGHKIAYDFEALKLMGEDAGFKVEKKNFNEGHEQILKETMDCLPEISLIVEFAKE